MTGIPVAWTCSAGAVTLLVVSHAAFVRFARPRRRFAFLFAGVPIAVLAAALAARAWTLGLGPSGHANPPWLEAAQATLVLLFCVQLACSLHAAVEHAVRGRLAAELFRAPGGRIPVEELIRRYDPDGAASRRLEMLVATGYLRREDTDRFGLTPKGTRFARAIRFLKTLYRLERGG